VQIREELQLRLRNVKLAIFDVDGVMTDGTLIMGDDGQEYKRFYARDGLGLRMLKNSGIELAIITGRTSSVVEHRAKDLDIEHLYQGRREKLPAFIDLCKNLKIDPSEVAFMGDDVIDLPIMLHAGLAMSVADAHLLVKQHAHWVSESLGGYGAVREACELIMHAQGTLEKQMTQYLTVSI